MNSIDSSKKLQFTISCPTDSVLEFLDLTFSSDVTPKQILVDVFSEPTNSLFTKCLLHVSLWRSTEKVPKSVALKLRQICDTNSKLKMRSNEYQ